MSMLLYQETPARTTIETDETDAPAISEIMIVAAQGRLDVLSAPILRERLDHLLSEGVTKFVVDLSAVSFLDSAGMAVLVNLLKRARQGGGDVKLVAPGATASQQILHLTKFDQVFAMADTVEAALADAW